MDAIRLDDDVHLIETARRQEEVMKENLDVVHAGFELKVVLAPRTQIHLAIDYDSGRTSVEKK